MKTIKFDCPTCNQELEGDEEYLYQEIKCPNCQDRVFPKVKLPPGVAARNAMNSGYAPPNSNGGQSQNVVHPSASPLTFELKCRIDAIRRNAGYFSLIGMVFFVLGIGVIVMACLTMSQSQNSMMSGIVIGSSCIGVGLGFYLIAQLVHIRANTEK